MARPEPEPGLPIKLEPCSNGEYLPPPMSPAVAETIRRSHRDAERNARRLGMSRRRFLTTAAGSATVLVALAACSRESSTADGTTTTGPGGTFDIPPESTTDTDAAAEALGGDEFIFDVQGHLLEYGPDSDAQPPNFPQSDCGDGRDCYDHEHFLDLYFNHSDTNVVVLSAVPFGEGLSPEVMDRARRRGNELCGDERVLMQGESNPSVGSIEGVLDGMDQLADTYPVRAWKVYTHAGGPGWYLDDHDPDAPQVGDRFLEHAVDVGIPLVAVHKGLSGGSRFASPVDVGPAAAAHPDVSIVVYHSGYESGQPEGPYDAAGADQGVNRLITSVRDAGLDEGSNVYAELGSTWRNLMSRPDDAAHVLGKLLVHLGEDNVVWGTDSIWYGSPQDQIEAFRAFEITDEYQERFGYPALTPERKAKILGLTSAGLYGVDPTAVPCDLSRAELSARREEAPRGDPLLGPRTTREVRAVQAAHGWD